MWIQSGGPLVIDCVFENNHSDVSGGAIYLGNGRARIFNCLFYQNSSVLWGGGIDNTGSPSHSYPIVIGCTFIENAADLGNADETGDGFRLKGSNTVVYNCVLWGNTPDSVEHGGQSPIIGNSLVQGSMAGFTDGGGNMNANPLFVNASANDYRLSSGSPAIDAGHNSPHAEFVGFLTDLGGEARFFDDLDTVDTGVGSSPIIDMGAYEYQGAEPCPADFTGDGIINFFDVSAFLQLFGAQDPEADFTDDGIWNFFDVSAFLQAFAAGCP